MAVLHIPRWDYAELLKHDGIIDSELRSALSRHGFVVLNNVPDESVAHLQHAMMLGRAFFALSQVNKDALKVQCNPPRIKRQS